MFFCLLNILSCELKRSSVTLINLITIIICISFSFLYFYICDSKVCEQRWVHILWVSCYCYPFKGSSILYLFQYRHAVESILESFCILQWEKIFERTSSTDRCYRLSWCIYTAGVTIADKGMRFQTINKVPFFILCLDYPLTM